MKPVTFDNHTHPNAYVWPEEDPHTLLPMDRTVVELHIQIASLNKRFERLSKVVEEMLTPKQQESVLQLFSK